MSTGWPTNWTPSSSASAPTPSSPSWPNPSSAPPPAASPPCPAISSGCAKICDRYGALLILDEVMCGMGRTGTMHAWEQEGITPDIQVIAKGLGGGYQPIGGILIAGRIVQALADGSGGFLHGQTYQAHPVACAAALEVQRIIRDDNLLANVRAMGRRLETALTERFGNHRHVGDVRGRGLFWALEFVADRASQAGVRSGAETERTGQGGGAGRAASRSIRWAARSTASAATM